MDEYPLEPGRDEMHRLVDAVRDRVVDFVCALPDAPATGVRPPPTRPAGAALEPGKPSGSAGTPSGPAGAPDPAALIDRALAAPPEHGGDLAELLDLVEAATGYAFETAGPGYFAYIPGGGLFASAVADLYTRVTNRYVGMSNPAPALAALEHGVVRWLGEVCGLGEGRGGLLTSGGSMANFSALVAARHVGLGEHIADGTLYLTRYAHQSMAKAARLAGLPASAVRVVPHDDQLRMRVAAAAEMIAADRAAGRRPFLLVGSAGTTDTGTVDPLPALGELAARERLWLHVDAAYGGPFRLTERGRARLAGTELADSVTLDPHKTLFLPFGSGALVVRDPAALRAAHEVGTYVLQDLDPHDAPDYAHLSPELSRDVRGVRLWLPLHLHGVAAFRDALDEKLDLAEMAYRTLCEEPALELPWRPELSIVAFRMRDDASSRRLLDTVNASGRVFVSSTTVDGRCTLRLCIVSHRSHADRVGEACEIIASAARRIAAD